MGQRQSNNASSRDHNNGNDSSTTVKRGLPPGPSGLPVLGSYLQWKGPETNLEWAQQYGPVYSVRMGGNQLVYLNTVELVEEYMELKGAALLGRPEGPAAIANGLLFGQGERWQENRRAFTRSMWTSSITSLHESTVRREADLVVQQLSQRLDTPLEVDTVLLPALTSRLVTLLLGQPLDGEGEEMGRLLRQMRELEEVDLTSIFTQTFLKVKRFRRLFECLGSSTIPDLFHVSEEEQALIRGWLDRRRAALAEAGGQPNPDSLLDRLLTSEEYVSLDQEWGDKELVQSVMDLFNGGVTSSLSALEFALLFLIHHPQVQVKVKAEIDKVVAGGDPQKVITWANREQFPYTRATLLEALRLGSVTPSSLPHVATEEVGMEGGYQIPEGTLVVASIFCLHRDPRFYENPEVFEPDRHLNAEGQVVTPRSFRPFGVGGRLCVGYQLAEIELFIFLARLVAAFRVRAADPSHPPPFHCVMRVVRRLRPFTCVLESWGDDPSTDGKSA